MRVETVDVWTPEPSRDVKDRDPVGEIYFTLKGQHDYTYDDIPALQNVAGIEFSKEACAKKRGHRYYLKYSTRGELYDPINLEHTNSATRIIDGRPLWRYIEVGYTCFAHYAHFLKNRNSTYYVFARRELGSPT